MRKLIILVLIIPLLIGIMSGIYSQNRSKRQEPTEYSDHYLEEKAAKILEYTPVSGIKEPEKLIPSAVQMKSKQSNISPERYDTYSIGVTSSGADKRPKPAPVQPKPTTVTKSSINRSERPERTELGEFMATAYDLSVEDCEKSKNHPEYGITASGLNIAGKDIRDRLVAADKKYFPFNTKIYIEFPDKIRYQTFNGEKVDLNGTYTVVDRGGAIKGKKVDIYFGEDKPGEKVIKKLVSKFGRRKVKVYEIGE